LNSEINIEDRIPVWEKLSLFYLDTELDDSDYLQIGLTILQSPFSLEQVKKINRREVFPILYFNLLIMTGEWAGFDIDWLSEKIVKRSRGRTVFSKVTLFVIHGMLKWMYVRHWKKVENAMTQLS